MKFAPKYFVGVKDGLGFATPDGTDKAAEKRKDTVRGWVGRYTYVCDGKVENTDGDYRTFDNVPVEGFSLGKSVSRWSTANKWFRITDPRGFDLEISAENLAELIQTTDILKGELQGKFVWMRSGATNYLVSENHESYLTRNDETLNTYKVQEGVPFKFNDNTWVYLGKFYTGAIAQHSYLKYKHGDYWTNRYRSNSHVKVTEYREIKDDRPVHVYAKKSVHWKTKEESHYIDFRRTKIPNKKCMASDDTWLVDNKIDLTDGFHDAYTTINYSGYGYNRRFVFAADVAGVETKLASVGTYDEREKLFNAKSKG